GAGGGVEGVRGGGGLSRGGALPGAGLGDDVRAFVRRSLLAAYATAERLREAARAEDAGTRYPASGLAADLRLVARLMKAGFGTRVYYVEQGRYDSHAGQLTTPRS